MVKRNKYGRTWEPAGEQLPESAWLVTHNGTEKIYVSEETGYVYLLDTEKELLYRCGVDDYTSN